MGINKKFKKDHGNEKGTCRVEMSYRVGEDKRGREQWKSEAVIYIMTLLKSKFD